MATPTLTNYPLDVLADLSAARSILTTARVSISDGPMKPWEKLNNATKYLTRQMDELVAPVFAELCEYEYPETHWGACNGGPCGDLAVEDGLCGLHSRAAKLSAALGAL